MRYISSWRWEISWESMLQATTTGACPPSFPAFVSIRRVVADRSCQRRWYGVTSCTSALGTEQVGAKTPPGLRALLCIDVLFKADGLKALWARIPKGPSSLRPKYAGAIGMRLIQKPHLVCSRGSRAQREQAESAGMSSWIDRSYWGFQRSHLGDSSTPRSVHMPSRESAATFH